jgi:hypothetical protein
VKAAHARSDADPQILRLSIDTKAKVKLGEFSRGGKLRGLEPVKALDHDMGETQMLIPFGILEVKKKQFNVVYGNSRETSDFIFDSFERWWRYRKKHYPHITKLMIDLDNGPEIESGRTQFIKRAVEFADKYQKMIELVYYGPAVKSVGDRVNAGVAKVKEFGKNMGSRAKAAGTAAKAHVSRNRAAYIAGGAGLAAGAVGGAIATRRKKVQNEN